jgi:hypothetical protein
MLSHRSKKLKAKGVAEGKRRVAILEARKALPFPEVAAPSKKAKLEVTSLKDFATAKAAFKDFLDFNKYLQQATDEEKEEYAKAVLGDSRGKPCIHSLERLKEDHEEAQQQVVVAKKSMVNIIADEETNGKVKEVVSKFEEIYGLFDAPLLPTILKHSAKLLNAKAEEAEFQFKLSLVEPFVTEYSAKKTSKELTELNERKEVLETTMSGLEAVKDNDEAVLKLFNEKKAELKVVLADIFKLKNDTDEVPLDIQHSQTY